MKIEIDELHPTKKSLEFWGDAKQRGMDGGNVKIWFDNGNCYTFYIQDMVQYFVHRTHGNGLTKKIKTR